MAKSETDNPWVRFRIRRGHGRVLGTKNAASTGKRVDLDAVVVAQ